MKLDFELGEGKRLEVGDNAVILYPNGSFALTNKGIYTTIIYTVHFMDKNDQPTTGSDRITLNYDEQDGYWVRSIQTHDGLIHIYDKPNGLPNG